MVKEYMIEASPVEAARFYVRESVMNCVFNNDKDAARAFIVAKHPELKDYYRCSCLYIEKKRCWRLRFFMQETPVIRKLDNEDED